MKLRQVASIVACAFTLWTVIGFGQSPDKVENNSVRVTVSMNADGSRTVYQFDDAQHTAVATTSSPDGKLLQKIQYEIDDMGRFSSGIIFGPDGRIQFKSRYKYDSAGRLQEETQSKEDGVLLHRIVHNYDPSGKETGYSIFDASGKPIGRVSAPPLSPTPSPKARTKKSR